MKKLHFSNQILVISFSLLENENLKVFFTEEKNFHQCKERVTGQRGTLTVHCLLLMALFRWNWEVVEPEEASKWCWEKQQSYFLIKGKSILYLTFFLLRQLPPKDLPKNVVVAVINMEWRDLRFFRLGKLAFLYLNGSYRNAGEEFSLVHTVIEQGEWLQTERG